MALKVAVASLPLGTSAQGVVQLPWSNSTETRACRLPATSALLT
jgi:hypothetical protein